MLRSLPRGWPAILTQPDLAFNPGRLPELTRGGSVQILGDPGCTGRPAKARNNRSSRPEAESRPPCDGWELEIGQLDIGQCPACPRWAQDGALLLRGILRRYFHLTNLKSGHTNCYIEVEVVQKHRCAALPNWAEARGEVERFRGVPWQQDI